MSSTTRSTGGKPAPPALPPRQSSSNIHTDSSPLDAPPAYDSIAATDDMSDQWASGNDPRTSSQQSLLPDQSNAADRRRKLLMVYIHGFMGNETSFRSFPAHVHNLLTVLLSDTHVVHTKIYPRYRSKRNITFARDDFSRWLEPHEGDKVDVVLLGHSMGGLLSAEVVLVAPNAPAGRPLKHRILGTINFDVPFLGMHPGVVKSGLASIFTSAEEPGDQWGDAQPRPEGEGSAPTVGQRMDTLWGRQDPNYNPQFPNDNILSSRKGWQNALHFVTKHSDHLFRETKRLVTSHLEFGGAMANYPELKSRYARIRALEEDDERVRKSLAKNENTPPRVRFVNYYTAATGRPKKIRSPSRSPGHSQNASRTNLAPQDAMGRCDTALAESSLTLLHRTRSPTISLEDHSDGSVVKKNHEIDTSPVEDWHHAAQTLTIQDPTPEADDGSDDPLSPTASLATNASLPVIPDIPPAPAPPDVSFIQDPAVRKMVEKEHARAMKAYEKAVRDREKLLRAHGKLEGKQRRKAERDAEKAAKEAEQAAEDAEKAKQRAEEAPKKELTHSEREALRLQQEKERMEAEGRRMRGEPEPPSAQAAPASRQESRTPSPLSGPNSDPSTSAPSPESPPISVPTSTTQLRSTTSNTTENTNDKPPKDHPFCSLPPKDGAGERDPTWIRVLMEGVDEVGAHCGLFFVDERYERLVGDVAGRVEGWVLEGLSDGVMGGRGEKGGW